MVDKYEDLGPANALPPPPPPPPGSRQPTAAGSQDRTELRSAQIGAGKEKGGNKGKGAAAEEEGEGEEVARYTTAQKVCMVTSGISAVFFLMAAIAAIVILLTGFKIFP